MRFLLLGADGSGSAVWIDFVFGRKPTDGTDVDFSNESVDERTSPLLLSLLLLLLLHRTYV